MEIQELKSYLKACIDAYQNTDEISKIISEISKNIDEVSKNIESTEKRISEVDLTREEFPLMAEEKKAKVFRGKTKEQYTIDNFAALLKDLLYFKEVMPDEFTVKNTKDNTTRKFSKKSSFGFGPVFVLKKASEMDYGNYNRFFVDELSKYKRVEVKGADVYCYADKSDTNPLKVFSFNHGFKKHLQSAWDKAQEQAEAKVKENEQMASVYQERYVKEAEDYKIKAKKHNDEQILKQQKEDERIESIKRELECIIIKEQLRVDLMKKESDSFADNLKTSKSILDQLLNTNVVYPKYRSFICICSLYDYIDTGRCTELTGPFGAYQRYEEDLRARLIIDSLSRIESRMDMVISNQATLANTIESGVRSLRNAIENVGVSINNSLARMESNQYSIREDLAKVGTGISETNNRLDENNRMLADSKRILAEYGKDTAATRYSVERIAKLQEYVNSVKFANGEFKGFEYKYPF